MTDFCRSAGSTAKSRDSCDQNHLCDDIVVTDLKSVATATSQDRAVGENGVHIRGLLLYAGSIAHGSTYLLRDLARKYQCLFITVVRLVQRHRADIAG